MCSAFLSQGVQEELDPGSSLERRDQLQGRRRHVLSSAAESSSARPEESGAPWAGWWACGQRCPDLWQALSILRAP